LSNVNVCKLLGIREDEVRFIEFYNAYPPKVGSRVLRASNIDTVMGRKHEKKYLERIKSKEAHEDAIRAIKAFVAKKKQANEMKFLPMMETVLNNSMWEQWIILIDTPGTEGLDWTAQSV